MEKSLIKRFRIEIEKCENYCQLQSKKTLIFLNFPRVLGVKVCKNAKHSINFG